MSARRITRWRAAWLIGCALALSACGARRPPTLTEQRAVLDARPTVEAADWARRGWWAYLAGDRPAAEAAFARAPGEPLAALGRARLADDALDARLVSSEAARATAGDGRVGLLARLWAESSARTRPDGRSSLDAALGPRLADRRALDDARYTVRVSFLPHLHRARLRDAPPRIEGDRLTVLGKWWALGSKAPDPDPDGVVITVWPLDAGPAHIELLARGPVMAWRGGALVVATAPDRFPPDTVRFTARGEGPLIVAWSADRRPRAWRWARPAPLMPPERGGPTVPDRAPGVDWVARYLTTEQALLDGDYALAATLLEGAPETPAFAALHARHVRLDPALPRTLARDQALARWTAVLPFAPARAHLELGRLTRRAGDVDAARAHLDAAFALAPEAWPVHRARVRLFLTLGWTEEARAAVDAAEAVAPDRCRLLADRAALDPPDVAGESDPVVEAMLACGQTLDAVERLLALDRPEAALATLDAGDHPGARGRRLAARALVGLGRLDEAAARLGEGSDVDDALLAVDLAQVGAAPPSDAPLAVRPSVEDGLAARLEGWMSAWPTAREALTVLAAWPDRSLFGDVMFDSEAIIAEFEGTVPLPGPAVRVLDHSALVYFADGTRLRWVHEILAIRSREAAEVYGELSLPGDAVRPVAIYTRKADGRRLFAEEVPEKETLSLRDVEDGDYIVAVYLEPGDNGYLYDGGYLTPRVYFQGADMPIFRQRFEIFAPDGDAPTYQRLGRAPAPARLRMGERAGLRFDASKTRVRPAESNAPPVGLWLDSVRVGAGVELADDLDYYRDRVLAVRRRTAAFDRWARGVAGSSEPIERARRLTRAVRDDIDGESGLIRDDAAASIYTGEGNRALVLSAALEATGVAHRMLLVRPAVRVPSGPFMQVADFPYLLIELADGTWIDPGPDRAAVGWLPFPMLGGDGLVVWPPDAPATPVKLPVDRAVADHRRVEMEAHWGADGIVRGAVVDTLVGQEAAVIGGYLSRLEPEMRPRLVERLLLAAIPAGQVIEFEDPIVDNLQDGERAAPIDGPLVLRYTFEADVGERLRLGAFPVGPGRRYALEGERALPLIIDLPTDQRVSIELTADRDFTVKGEPGAVAHDGARFALDLDRDPGEADDDLELTARLSLPGRVVEPEGYGDFAEWARAVDDRERVTLTVVEDD